MHINGRSEKQDAQHFLNHPLLSDEIRLDEDQGRGGELHDKENYGSAGSVFALLVAIILMKVRCRTRGKTRAHSKQKDQCGGEATKSLTDLIRKDSEESFFAANLTRILKPEQERDGGLGKIRMKKVAASVRYIRKSANAGAAFVVDRIWRECVGEPPSDENGAGIGRGGTQAPGDEGCTADDGRGGAQAPDGGDRTVVGRGGAQAPDDGDHTGNGRGGAQAPGRFCTKDSGQIVSIKRRCKGGKDRYMVEATKSLADLGSETPPPPVRQLSQRTVPSTTLADRLTSRGQGIR